MAQNLFFKDKDGNMVNPYEEGFVVPTRTKDDYQFIIDGEEQYIRRKDLKKIEINEFDINYLEFLFVTKNVEFEITNPTDDWDWEEIREIRNIKLRDTDWTRLDDCGLSEEEKTKYQTYRQELRDITETFSNPDKVKYPEHPNKKKEENINSS